MEKFNTQSFENTISSYISSHPEILENAVQKALEKHLAQKKMALMQEIEVGLADSAAGKLITDSESELRMQKLKAKHAQ